jgi:RNA polymerase subunit RPABC4/transcription elongation factor Spt4
MNFRKFTLNNNIMKCPVCVEKNLKSNVYVGMSTSTAMYCAPYYDEDGKYHSHDGNTHTTSYSCSNGHTWAESNTGTCPSCDFGKDSHSIKIYNSEEPQIAEESEEDIASIFGGEPTSVEGTNDYTTGTISYTEGTSEQNLTTE